MGKKTDTILMNQGSNSQWRQIGRVTAHLLPQSQELDLMPGHCTVVYCCYYTGCRMSEMQRMHCPAGINKSLNPIYVFSFKLSRLLYYLSIPVSIHPLNQYTYRRCSQSRLYHEYSLCICHDLEILVEIHTCKQQLYWGSKLQVVIYC